MIGPSSSAPLPGITSQYNDRLGRIYGPGTLEANWAEERLQRAAGMLKSAHGEKAIRPYEPDLAGAPRTARNTWTFKSNGVVSDGLNEHLTMNETFYTPLESRPANPVGAGTTTPYDEMLMRFAQQDEPKTRQSKDRMSNVQNEVRPMADSEQKMRKHFITPASLSHAYVSRVSQFTDSKGFGAIVPKHPDGYAERQFSTTTGEALAMGIIPNDTLGVRAYNPSSLPSSTHPNPNPNSNIPLAYSPSKINLCSPPVSRAAQR